MKKNICFLLVSLITFCSAVHAAVEGERFIQSEEAVKTALFGHIDAKGLKAMLDSQTAFTLLDARGDKWRDGNIIPGALFASFESSKEELAALIPHKDTLVVVYCYSFTCPLSNMLISRLLDLGYTNIIEYPAGLKEWRDVANYSVAAVTK